VIKRCLVQRPPTDGKKAIVRFPSEVLHVVPGHLHAQDEEGGLSKGGLHPIPGKRSNLEPCVQLTLAGILKGHKCIIEPQHTVQMEDQGNGDESGSERDPDSELVPVVQQCSGVHLLRRWSLAIKKMDVLDMAQLFR
jgi:hypothetical protein